MSQIFHYVVFFTDGTNQEIEITKGKNLPEAAQRLADYYHKVVSHYTMVKREPFIRGNWIGETEEFANMTMDNESFEWLRKVLEDYDGKKNRFWTAFDDLFEELE